MSVRGRVLAKGCKAKKISRDVFAAWIRRVGSIDKNIPSENVPALLSDMHLHPTKAQVGEMLQCAKDRGPHLTYREFYNFAAQVKRELSNDKGSHRALIKNGEKKKRSSKMPQRSVKHEVFLGGSCNPTTWRQEIAIPLLEKLGVSYFNPQVAEWSADLVEIEYRAKEEAIVLFYVLDRRTRNVVGIVEAANFIGSRRNLVLVLDKYNLQEPVAGEPITHTEYQELCSSFDTLKDLVEVNGSHVFYNINTALNYTASALKQKRRKHGRVNSSKSNFICEDEDKLLKIGDAFEKNGKRQIIDIENSSLSDIVSSIRNSTSSNLNSSSSIDGHDGTKSALNGLNERLTLCCQSESEEIDWINVYVGGSCYDPQWKQTAFPILKESGLRFEMNSCSINCSKACGRERSVMEKSSVLVFIITGNSRGLETMALASYYMGRGRNMVLCIQNIPESCSIMNEKLSISAVNDYNRGRVYLRDFALKKGVPVTDTVSEAVQCAIDKSLALPRSSNFY